jgi:dihydroorotate dehydrogenase electron transfer subunit
MKNLNQRSAKVKPKLENTRKSTHTFSENKKLFTRKTRLHMMLKMNEMNYEIAIREMAERDVDEVLAIEADSYPLPWNRDHFLDELKSDHAFPLVAIGPDERIIAYICPRYLLDEGHIYNIAVQRAFRKLGVGRLLLEKAIGICQEKGVVTLYLEVRNSNQSAIALYRKIGFVSTGTRSRYYENGEDAILMEYNFPDVRPRMQFNSLVISNTEVSPGYFRIRLTAPPEIAGTLPGKFVMVKVRDSIDPLLRRPFGIFDVGCMGSEYPGGGTREFFEILYKVVGKGTTILANLHHGDRLDILGPLGNGFGSDSAGTENILVGGGVGLAPLYYLGRVLARSSNVRLFAGGRSRDDIICITEFERLGIETYVSTDDGTLGEEGVVTEALGKYLLNDSAGKSIYACGPFPMLKAVSVIAGRFGIPCQVSLEAYMACGVGACLGCVIKGRNHTDESPDYRCVCKEGPVFDHRDLLWD